MVIATVIISAVGALIILLQPYLKRAANVVVDRLDDMINIEREISNLRSTVELIQGILQEAEEVQIDNVRIQTLLSGLVDIGYEARDVLEDFITFAKSVNSSSDPLELENHIKSLNEFAKHIKSLRETFDEKKKQCDDFLSVISVVGGGGGHKKVREIPRPEISFIEDNQSDDMFVGREDVKEEIMTKLLDYKDKTVRLISISRMAGVGKTTLVQSIYNDKRLKQALNIRAWNKKWLCIGQKKFSAKEIMAEIIGDQKKFNRPELKPIGREIVMKLDGLPLAVQVVGSSLLNEPEATWSDFLKTWERMLQKKNGDRVMASLRWSYNLLRPHLKVCFNYFSLFPKNYAFDKKVLVELWMTHDLIQNVSGIRAEDTGADYFEELVNDSLLKCDDRKYVMHDLIQNVSGIRAEDTGAVLKEEFLTVNGLHSTDQIERARHITVNHDRNYSNNLRLCKTRDYSLYTL